MARPTKRAVTACVRLWQKRLGLSDWKITVVYAPDPEDGSEASCSAKPEYKSASLCFDLEFIPADELDDWVAHELLHCVLWPLGNAAETMADGDKAKVEWVRTVEEAVTTQLERIVTALARAE